MLIDISESLENLTLLLLEVVVLVAFFLSFGFHSESFSSSDSDSFPESLDTVSGLLLTFNFGVSTKVSFAY